MSQEAHPAESLGRFLARIAGLPPRQAAEAASADQQARWGRGDPVPAERYLEALPQLAASPEDALILLRGEARLGGTDTLNLGRLRGAYPQLAERLAALAGGGPGGTGTDFSLGTADSAVSPDTVSDASHATAPPGPALPALPGYEPVRLLGQGGMGVVWEALQVSLNRRVALKLIRAADLAGPEEVVRFLSEAEALAAVEHPNVVRIYEARQHAQQPYMAMEYVAGGSLADRLRQGPLGPRDAARAVEQAARGVQAAHDRGIIHRDLKPANLLVGDGPLAPGPDDPAAVVRVTDFGLARRTEAGTGLTQSGVVMGTPPYMAPEQARGDTRRVGPAADVYGLGAVLYECLTGRPPFVAPTAVDVLVQVVNDEPVPARSLAPTTPRDLETICHKALRKLPDQRYASAREMADDLRRFAAGEPILARPVGALERAARWVRRHPAVTSLLAVIAVGVGLAFWAVKAEQLRTARERDRAVEAEREARENLEQAQKAVDECFGLAKNDPRLQAEALRPVRKLLLEKTLPFYQAFVSREPDNPAVAARQADYLQRVGDITLEIGRPRDALKSYQQARDVYDRLSQQEPANPDYQSHLAWACNSLGYLQSTTGQPAEAMANYERAAVLYTALRKAHPDVGLYLAGHAQTYHNQGILLWHTGQRDESIRRYQKALEIRQELARDNPALTHVQADLAHSWNNLGANLSSMGRQKEAIASYEKAADVWRKLAQAHPKDSQFSSGLATVHGNIAFAQTRQGQHQPAEENYRKALGLHTQLAKAHPEVTQYQELLASTWNNLGMLHSLTYRHRDALVSFKQSREIYARLHTAYPEVMEHLTGLGGACNNLASAHRQAGNDAQAIAAYDDGIRHLQAANRKQPDHRTARAYLLNGYVNRALLLGNLGRHQEAAADWHAVWAMSQGANREGPLWMKALSLALAGDPLQASELSAPSHILPWLRRGHHLDLAGLCARMAQAAANPARPLPVREAQSDRWARWAMAVLDKARLAGNLQYPGALDALKNDPAFASLRPRADFQQLVASLAKPGPVGGAGAPPRP